MANDYVQILDVAQGIFYLHGHPLGPIIHGDLKGVGLLAFQYSVRRNYMFDR